MLYSIISSLFLIGAYSQAPPVDAVPVAVAQPEPPVVPPVPPVSPVTTAAAQSAATPPATTSKATTKAPGNVNPNPNPNPGPDVVPPVVPPVPPTNPNLNPITPQQPPVTPQPPPVTQQPPATGQQPPVSQQPPATPQYGGYPQQPQYNPYGAPGFGGGFMPGMGMGLMDPQVLKCEFGQCRNRRITMSPGQGFKLECNMMRQCDGLDLTLNVGVDPTNFGSQVNEINDFNFDAPQNGVTIRINNPMMQNIEVNNINCKRPMSCQNMRVLAGYGVELWEVNVKCEMPGACPGCTINGQSCEMISMMTGNGHGGVAPGFGYMNQPNIPAPQTGFGAPAPPQAGAPQQGAPQQPQYPQQQYPQYPQYGYPQYQQPQFYPMYNPWI